VKGDERVENVAFPRLAGTGATFYTAYV
jgi:hypothetical protein